MLLQKHPESVPKVAVAGITFVKKGKGEPPCECVNCSSQFLSVNQQDYDRFRYMTTVTPAAAKTSLANFISQIDADRAYLTDLCKNFGNTIISRWRKKSRNKREALLLLADLTIEKKPWFRLWIEGDIATWQELREHRKSWLLPYMSTAIMKANPSVLLSLLHQRVHHSPEEWAPFDSHQFRQAWALGYFDLEYCGKYCVVMHGVDYGKLVPWSKKAAESSDIVGYPRALLIIEAQALMFSRLRAIVDLILEGVDRNTASASDKWQEMVRAGFKQSNNIELWSDYVNQPFSAPPEFDVDYYCSIAEARMQAAHDHLWLLQTDLSYFRRFVRVLAVGEVYRTPWRYVLIAKDIHLAVEDYLVWRGLFDEWSSVRNHYRRFRDSIYPGQPLPRRLESSLILLESTLLTRVDLKIKHLSGYISQRPGFQHIWEWTMLSTPPSKPGKQMFAATRKTDKGPAYEQYCKDTLDWTLTELQSRPNDDSRFDHSELFARLEAHLAEASPEERARLDETVYAKMSDFTAQHEMLFALRLHRPAFAHPGIEEVRKLAKEDSTLSTRLLVIDAAAYKSKLHAFSAESIKLLEQSTPAVGCKNEAWLESRTAERIILNKFWEEARVTFRGELTFTSMEQEEIDDAISVISVSKSTEYTEIVQNERLQVSAAIAAAAALTKNTTNIMTEAASWETGPDVSTLAIEERAVKPKTRPLQPASASVNDAVPLEPGFDTKVEFVADQQRIAATTRALEVIRKMYPTSTEEVSAKDTDWDLFVHAMNDLNFNARNVGGSGVALEHPSKKKIIVHRPHPVAKIDSIMLQSVGKRLQKHFGWSRETFVGV
ncbi:hypothetical protein M436DRAFT_56638 [Aureobasidium namibiae CBS 147.97]|uniref:Uncharacterized protein n=1 Tax=Aureobasidium namibiae CBS 147.97 TaxID=1043004 RepID=A0A074WHA3_9PEZI